MLITNAWDRCESSSAFTLPKTALGQQGKSGKFKSQQMRSNCSWKTTQKLFEVNTNNSNKSHHQSRKSHSHQKVRANSVMCFVHTNRYLLLLFGKWKHMRAKMGQCIESALIHNFATENSPKFSSPSISVLSKSRDIYCNKKSKQPERIDGRKGQRRIEWQASLQIRSSINDD